MKKIILIILSLMLIAFSGCTSISTDDGVIRTENGTPLLDGEQLKVTLTKNDLGYDAWGRPKTITDASLFHGVWTYDIPKTMWIVKDNGVENLNTSSLVVSENGELVVYNGGELISKRHPRYQPNRGLLFSTAVILPNSEAIGNRQFGLFNSENGYFFKLNNGTLYAVIRTTRNGTTYNDEKEIPLPAGLNLSKGNVYDIQAQWRGLGNIKFFINLQEVYSFDYLGTLNYLSVSNPALPITFTTTAGNNPIKAGCVDVTSEGGIKETRQYNSLTSGEISLTAIETPIIVLKINETYKNKLNTRDISLRRISGFADANTIIRVYSTRDPSSITAGTWINYNGGNIQYQLNPTFTSTVFTKKLIEERITAFNTLFITNPDEEIGEFYLTSGDYLIVTLQAKSNTLGGVTIEWGEEI